LFKLIVNKLKKGLLAEQGRLDKLPSIATSFETIMRAHRNELQVEVASAEVS
jgi:F0F1-type ATP synthase delta subunit